MESPNNVMRFPISTPRQRAINQLRKRPGTVFDSITKLHLKSKDMLFWKEFAMDITTLLKQGYDERKHELSDEQKNFFSLALIVFASFMNALIEWEKNGSEKDKSYQLSYLDFFYIMSYLNAGSDMFPKYYNTAHQYLDEILLAVTHDFEYSVELVMEYSQNLHMYAGDTQMSLH